MIPTRDRIAEVVLDVIRTKESIGIYPHVGADGDALGSAIGLALALKQAGASARVFVDERINPRLGFLPALDLVSAYADLDTKTWPQNQALAVAVDCTEPERLGCRQELYRDAPIQAALDHHVSSGESGGLRLIDPLASATGEIIFELIKELENQLDQPLLTQDAAMALMTAIVSDTGGFVYSNTTARTFAIAAQLMAYDPDLRLITYRLFHESTKIQLRLRGEIFSKAQFLFDDRLTYARVDQGLMQQFSATDTDLDGFVSELRSVSGVEVAFMFRELSDGAIRINIRSNESFHASDFARPFGGGGHAKAAGMTIRHQSLDEVVDLVVAQAGQWLNG
ncbi:MAG: bifunctional oligoribonuclease/PAP phosphatase NrnA [Eubacteriales bacterium]|nr:bifunctional oligoribonuclease/PAP phosphatase NrnA [Eubacteriales bacterium]